MCYYNGVKVTKSEFIRLKSIERAIAKYDFLDKPLNIGFQYGNIPILKKLEGKDDLEVTQMEWGFLPDTWYRKPIDTRAKAERFRKGFPDLFGKMEKGIITLNAMSEELLLPGKIYRESALERRCLAISTGFFEWQHIYRKNKKTGLPLKTPDKYPYFISLPEQEYFYIASVYKPWTDVETGEVVDTAAFVTAKANWLMKQVHNSKERMPTILNEELAYEWLFGKLDEKRILEIAATQFPAEKMHAYTIDKNFISAEDPTLPVAQVGVPPIQWAA